MYIQEDQLSSTKSVLSFEVGKLVFVKNNLGVLDCSILPLEEGGGWERM